MSFKISVFVPNPSFVWFCMINLIQEYCLIPISCAHSTQLSIHGYSDVLSSFQCLQGKLFNPCFESIIILFYPVQCIAIHYYLNIWMRVVFPSFPAVRLQFVYILSMFILGKELVQNNIFTMSKTIQYDALVYN